MKTHIQHPKQLRRRAGLTIISLALLLLSGLALYTPQASGADLPLSTIEVNTAADSDTADGDCSLREAIVAANTDTAYNGCNAGAGADTITFAGNYTITLGGSQLPVITSTVTINGNGPANTIIQAHASPNTATHRVFTVGAAGNLTLDNASVQNGRSPGNSGGGIENLGALTVSNSTFSGNVAGSNYSGGGIFNSGTLTVINTAFSENSAAAGGAIFSNNVLTVTNSTFSGNASNSGGGFYNWGSLSITDSTISGNTAGDGGGIYNSKTLVVTNTTFENNAATAGDGGAIENEDVTTVTSSTFYNNSASGKGGAIHNGFGYTLDVTNSTFSGNNGLIGSSIHNYGTFHLKNTILSDSLSGVDCYNISGDTIDTNINNLIETNGPSGHMCGTPVSTADPMIGSLQKNGGPTETMALLPGSPAIDSGDDAACAATDQRGIARPQGDACDIGAYEESNLSYALCFVESTGDNLTDYARSDASALQDAVNAAGPGDTLKIAGTCTGVTYTSGISQTVYIDKALSLMGAYTYTNWLIQDPGIYATTLDADAQGRVVYVAGNANVTLDNLTLTHGEHSGNGAGIYTTGDITVTNSIIAGNTSTGGVSAGLYLSGVHTGVLSNSSFADNHSLPSVDGGAISNDDDILWLDHVDFINNSSGRQGGALSNSGTTIISDSLFYSNTAYTFGGAIYNNGQLTVTHTTVDSNLAATGHGGAFHSSGASDGQAVFINSTISNNSSEGTGGLSHAAGHMTLENVTVSGNTSTNASVGGISSWAGAVAITITHSTISNNAGGAGVNLTSSGTGSLTNSIIEGASGQDACGTVSGYTSGGYNLSNDASCTFMDASGDLTEVTLYLLPLADNGGPTWTHLLLLTSPARNAIPYGTNGCGTTYQYDQRGYPRPIESSCDIGAVEISPITLFLPVTIR